MTDLSPLTATEIDELRRLEKAATPGPWFVYSEYEVGYMPCIHAKNEHDDHGFHSPVDDVPGNLELAAAARNALPRLIAAIEELQEAARLDDEVIKALRREGETDAVLIDTGHETIADLRRQLAEREAEVERLKRPWLPFSTVPHEALNIEVLDENGDIDEVSWRDQRYCMLGPPQGSRGPGWVSHLCGHLPVDGPYTHWRPIA